MKRESRFHIALRLIHLVRPLWKSVVWAAVCGLLGGLCVVLIPVLGSFALLDFLQNPIAANLFLFGAAIVLLAILRGAFRYGESTLSARLSYTGMAILRDRIFGALRNSAPVKFSGQEKGRLVSIIMSDVENLEVFYEHTLVRVISTALYVLILTIFIGFFHPVLGLLAFAAYSIVGFLIPFVSIKCSKKTGEKLRQKSGELSGYLLDSLRGVSTTLQYGGSGQRVQEMEQQTAAILKEERKMRLFEGGSRGITDAFVIFFDVCMILVGAALYQQGSVDFAGVLIPSICLIESFEPCLELVSLGTRLSKTFAAGKRVLALLDEQTQVPEIEGKPSVPFCGAKVEHVTVLSEGYPVLKDASIEIKEHTIVGLTGPSSSGKSTLLNLLMYFGKPDTGTVEISGVPIGCVNTEDLRNMESLVTQDTYLFMDTIFNNLRIAKEDATMEEVWEACKKASVHDFIMSLPRGYDTQISELGDSLSGGERQRLGLARAFLHGAPFLLLDEPTSNLDSLNEAVILRSLHNQRKDKTVLLVSHRPSALCIADKVYSAERGNLREVP